MDLLRGDTKASIDSEGESASEEAEDLRPLIVANLSVALLLDLFMMPLRLTDPAITSTSSSLKWNNIIDQEER